MNMHTSKLTIDRAAFLLSGSSEAKAEALAIDIAALEKFDSVRAFIKSVDAQNAIVDLVETLVDVADDAGGQCGTWDDISDDASLDSVLSELGGIYLEAKSDGEDDILRELIEEYADDCVRDLDTSRRKNLKSAVEDAADLDDLLDALEAADAYAERRGIRSLYDVSGLPKFGGEILAGAEGVFSCDEDRLLYGFGEWRIEQRGVDLGPTVDQRPLESWIVDDVEYRIEDRFYLGADQFDSLKITMWRKQDEQTWVRDGSVTIDAFERDVVLLEEMMTRVGDRIDEIEDEEEIA